MGLEFDLDELVAKLAARGTCRGDSQLVKLVKYFKNVFKKNIVELPSIQISSLNFHAQLEKNVIFFKIKIVIIVH